ncbi:MAG: hypothetical protein QM680_02250 [Luteolibacter sp.]
MRQGTIGKDSSQMQWYLTSSLGRWADKDLPSAMRWFDEQMAAGTFDSKALNGKSRSLVRFASVIISQLTKNDPQAAIERALQISPEERDNLFQSVFQGSAGTFPESYDGNFAKVVHATLGKEESGKAFASYISMMERRDKDYGRIDQFIANANATPEDKAAIVQQVINSGTHSGMSESFDRESFDSARTWAARHSPDSVDRATGEALANTLWRNQSFEKISAVALDYQQSTGSDDVLAAFLESSSVRYSKNREPAKSLISRIKDPAVRERIQNLREYKNP